MKMLPPGVYVLQVRRIHARVRRLMVDDEGGSPLQQSFGLSSERILSFGQERVPLYQRGRGQRSNSRVWIHPERLCIDHSHAG
jgi:hypothetical protein